MEMLASNTDVTHTNVLVVVFSHSLRLSLSLLSVILWTRHRVMSLSWPVTLTLSQAAFYLLTYCDRCLRTWVTTPTCSISTCQTTESVHSATYTVSPDSRSAACNGPFTYFIGYFLPFLLHVKMLLTLLRLSDSVHSKWHWVVCE